MLFSRSSGHRISSFYYRLLGSWVSHEECLGRERPDDDCKVKGGDTTLDGRGERERKDFAAFSSWPIIKLEKQKQSSRLAVIAYMKKAKTGCTSRK